MTTPQQTDLFWSSSVSGDFCADVVISEDNEVLVFSAAGNDLDENEANSISNAGAIYVRAKSGDLWVNEYKIVSPSREIDAFFGGHLAIVGTRAGNGLVLAVTSRGEGSNLGRVYLFTEVAGVFTHKHTLTASDGTAGDNFGFTLSGGQASGVALFSIGAPFVTVDGVANAGQVYLFTYTYSGETVAETEIFTAKTNREIVLNGGFQFDASNWTANNGASLTISVNRLVITNTIASSGYASQIIPTVIGEQYTATVDFTLSGGVVGWLMIGTTLLGKELGIEVFTSTSSGKVTFVATTTATYVVLFNAGIAINDQVIFDNVSVKLSQKVYREHLINGNFLTVAGWSKVGNTGLFYTDGYGRVVRLSTGGTIYQSFPTVIGRTYLATVDFAYHIIEAAASLLIGTGVDLGDLGSDTLSVPGQLSVTFTATAVTTYISLVAGSEFLDSVRFDNASVGGLGPVDHILNGEFPNNTDHWTAFSNVTIAIGSSDLRITIIAGTATTVYCYQLVPTVVGLSYTVTVDVSVATATSVSLWVGKLSGDFEIGSDTSTVSATLSVTFTANEPTTAISLAVTGDAAEFGIFDNVSMSTNDTYFGYTLGMSSGSSTFPVTGGVIAAGGRETDESGRVHVISQTADGWGIDDVLHLPAPVANDYFGSSISAVPANFSYYPITVNSDGSDIIVGAYGAETAGKVTVWAGPTLVKTYLGSDFTLPDETTLPYFGSSIHMTDNALVVGAQEFDTVANSDNDRGAVFHAHKQVGSWGPLEKLFQPTTNNDKDFFGYRPYVTDTYIAVAISDFTGNAPDQGAVVTYITAGFQDISATDVEVQKPVDYLLVNVPTRRRVV